MRKQINYLAVFVGAVAAFLVSSLYYSPLLFGNIWRAVDSLSPGAITPSIGRVLVELARTVAIAYVLALVLARSGATELGDALRTTVLLWFGFSALMWMGAIMWEHTPWQVAAIHSGDWLAKTLLLTFVQSVWHRRPVQGPALS